MKTFNNYTELALFLKDNDIHGKDTVFLSFLNAFKKINKGCSCSKSKRIDFTVTQYIGLAPKMTAEFVDPIKLHYGVQTVQFKHNDGLFFEG